MFVSSEDRQWSAGPNTVAGLTSGPFSPMLLRWEVVVDGCPLHVQDWSSVPRSCYAYNTTFPCMEANYPYAIKNQRGGSKILIT